MSDFKKNTALTGFTFVLINAATGAVVTTGAVAGYVTLDGSTQFGIGGTPVHEGNGQWSVNITAAEMNGNIVGLLFIHASALPVQFTIQTTVKTLVDLNDLAATEVVSNGAITTTSGAVKTDHDGGAGGSPGFGLPVNDVDANWVSGGRIYDILVKVRDSLSDQDKTRWSDARLLRILDEGQIDIAMKSRMLKTSTNIGVQVDKNTYELPDDSFMITRVVGSRTANLSDSTDLERVILPVKTHAQMDKLDPTWESRTGNGLEYIVFDKMKPREFKIYPIPLVSDEISEHVFTSDFGLVVLSSEDVVTPDFGVVTNITTSATLTASFSSDFGVVTNMTSLVASLAIYFAKRPATIDGSGVIDVDISLEVEPIFDKALKHYVIGHAYRDDQDTQNRVLGNEEISLYSVELEEAMTQSSKDFTDGYDINSDYRSGTLVYNTGFYNGTRKNYY